MANMAAKRGAKAVDDRELKEEVVDEAERTTIAAATIGFILDGRGWLPSAYFHRSADTKSGA